MSDPIDSSSWTGPLVEQTQRRGAFTYRPGEPAITSDYARILAAQPKSKPFPAELRGVIRLSLLAIVSQPLMLWGSWLLLHSLIDDQFVADNRLWLVAWGCSAVALPFLQPRWRSTAGILARKILLGVGVLATACFSGAYVYLGVDAHAHAVASKPERTFELSRSCGRRCVEAVHQREDGSSVEGVVAGPPVAYAPVCTLAQYLRGSRGFAWVRVLERSQRSEQISWPIRREACFGNEPVSSLHG